jgi:hypothetical protein
MKSKSKILLEYLKSEGDYKAEEALQQLREAIRERQKKIKPSAFSSRSVKIR